MNTPFVYGKIAENENFTDREQETRLLLGTSANIKNLKKATLEKDLIDITPGERIELQDPMFEYWLKSLYR